LTEIEGPGFAGAFFFVMSGLVPGIDVFIVDTKQDADGRA